MQNSFITFFKVNQEFRNLKNQTGDAFLQLADINFNLKMVRAETIILVKIITLLYLILLCFLGLYDIKNRNILFFRKILRE